MKLRRCYLEFSTLTLHTVLRVLCVLCWQVCLLQMSHTLQYSICIRWFLTNLFSFKLSRAQSTASFKDVSPDLCPLLWVIEDSRSLRINTSLMLQDWGSSTSRFLCLKHAGNKSRRPQNPVCVRVCLSVCVWSAVTQTRKDPPCQFVNSVGKKEALQKVCTLVRDRAEGKMRSARLKSGCFLFQAGWTACCVSGSN